MNRKEQAETVIAVSQFFSTLGERLKQLLLKLPPGILVNLILILGVALLSALTFKFLTKGAAPVKIPNTPIEVTPWLILSAITTIATALLILWILMPLTTVSRLEKEAPAHAGASIFIKNQLNKEIC